MAQQWPEPISDVTLGKALKRIHFTHPKRPTAIANVIHSPCSLEPQSGLSAVVIAELQQ
jgi:hypothetical protein